MSLDRLCIHTMTTKPWTLPEAVKAYDAADVPAITVWRQHLTPCGVGEGAKILRESGLRVTSLCRGGFFPHATASERDHALDDNRRAIDEARAIGAPMVVLVCGAVPGMPLEVSRDHIRAGIEAVLPHADACGITLAIEPLHPMYADMRSAVNTLRQANDMTEAIDHHRVGIALDVYHVWWDPDLETEIARAGNRIAAFHVCDWRTPTRDMLNDRGLMGEGCIDIPRIRGLVEAAGFDGDIEVEVFSERWWSGDQHRYLAKIKEAFQAYV